MNILVSLLLYNPLEALLLIRFCDVFTKRTFKLSDIISCYVLGIVNLIFQNFRTMFSNPVCILICDMFIMFIPMILILFIYYNNVVIYRHSVKRVTVMNVFMIQMINFITTSLVINFFNYVFGNIFTFRYASNYYEFVVNICLRIFQLGLIIVISKYFK